MSFVFAKGQVYQSMPQAGYGPVKRMLFDSVLTIPIGINTLRNITGGKDTAQLRYNKSDSSVYVYSGTQWIKIGTGGGGGGGGADSVTYFTKFRSDTMRTNIYNQFGNYVPYTGATNDVDLGTFKMNAQSFHVKGTAGNGHIGFKHQSASASAGGQESSLWANTDGNLAWQNANLFRNTFITNGITANRDYTFPNASGTIPLSVNGYTSNGSGNIDMTYQRNAVPFISPTTALVTTDSTQFRYNNTSTALEIGASKGINTSSSISLNASRLYIEGNFNGAIYNVGSGMAGGGVYDQTKRHRFYNRGNLYLDMYSNTDLTPQQHYSRFYTKVGIGQEPDSALTINGGLRLINGTQASGRILQSDANGGASWVAASSVISKSVGADGLTGSDTITLGGTSKQTINIDKNPTASNKSFNIGKNTPFDGVYINGSGSSGGIDIQADNSTITLRAEDPGNPGATLGQVSVSNNSVTLYGGVGLQNVESDSYQANPVLKFLVWDSSGKGVKSADIPSTINPVPVLRGYWGNDGSKAIFKIMEKPIGTIATDWTLRRASAGLYYIENANYDESNFNACTWVDGAVHNTDEIAIPRMPNIYVDAANNRIYFDIRLIDFANSDYDAEDNIWQLMFEVRFYQNCEEGSVILE